MRLLEAAVDGHTVGFSHDRRWYDVQASMSDQVTPRNVQPAILGRFARNKVHTLGQIVN